MSKTKSFLYLIVYVAGLLLIRFVLFPSVFPSADQLPDLWFSSGLLLIILGIFVTEKYFTKPSDVIVNSLTAGIALYGANQFHAFPLYNYIFLYLIGVGLLALITLLLKDEEKPPSVISQKLALWAYSLSTTLGASKLIFSIIFISSIFSTFLMQSNLDKFGTFSFLLICFWGTILLLNDIDNKLINPIIASLFPVLKLQQLGIVGEVSLPNWIYVKKAVEAPKYRIGDIVTLHEKYNKTESNEVLGMIVDDRQQEKASYIGIYILKGEYNNKLNFCSLLPETGKDRIASKTLNSYEAKYILANYKRIVGYVHKGSDIDVLKIRLITNSDESNKLLEGDLLTTFIYEKPGKYQIINAETFRDNEIESQKEGSKIITAQQIGFWDENKKIFENVNWVPRINSLVFVEVPGGKEYVAEKQNFYVGRVPRSDYPVYIDLNQAINHHIAIIGKTGTGKSFMAAKLIKKLLENEYQVIIFETDRENKQSLTKYVGNMCPGVGITVTPNSSFSIKDEDQCISIDFDQGSKAKDTGTVNFSQASVDLMEKIVARQVSEPNHKQIVIVMEEAYDFIPESNFGEQKFGQGVVSRTSQLVLKCRKHDIGIVIITQRTAIVSKTILNQCHTVIALQSFDETTKSFMSSYIGNQYLDSMAILPKFRCVLVGKGSTCDKPIILDFKDKS